MTGVRRSKARRARLLAVGVLTTAAVGLLGWPGAAVAAAHVPAVAAPAAQVPAAQVPPTSAGQGTSRPGMPRLDAGVATGAAAPGAVAGQPGTVPAPGGQSGAPAQGQTGTPAPGRTGTPVPGQTGVPVPGGQTGAPAAPSATQQPAPQPSVVEQPAEDGGIGLGLLMLGVAVVAALGAGALLAASRRRPAAAAAGVASGRARIAWGTPGSDPTAPVVAGAATAGRATTGAAGAAAGGRTVADAVRDAQHVETLMAALREVALHGPSDAIRQQVERLLNGSRVRREDLVDSCVRYRDQLAERDPALAAHLLGALAQVGVTELVADGEAFDPHRHQSMDVQDTPYAYLRDVVATTTRPGYLDNGRVLRLPEVIVYRFVPTGGHEGQQWNAAQ